MKQMVDVNITEFSKVQQLQSKARQHHNGQNGVSIVTARQATDRAMISSRTKNNMDSHRQTQSKKSKQQD